MFWGKKSPYTVTIHIDGRHPYLKTNELDYESRDVRAVVMAKNWNDAAYNGLQVAFALDGWAYSVKSIEQGMVDCNGSQNGAHGS